MAAVTLYRGGPIYSAADPHATALATDGDTIAWVGEADDAPTRPDRVVELDGALLAPAFVDAHVHVTDTGLGLTSLELSAVRDAAGLLDALAAHVAASPATGVVLGGGWDDSTWRDPRLPTGAELARAAGDRPVYLAQASCHSALCSPALTAQVAGVAALPGYDPDGWHRLAAHDALRAVALSRVDAATRAGAQRAALGAAAAAGIGCVHECAGPVTSSEADLTALLALAAAGGVPQVIGYWGELGGVEAARALGAVGAAGDLYADGALGSADAYLAADYHDVGGRGHAYLTADQIAEHIVACTRAGLQGGFHSIGDAATATVLAGMAAAAEAVGLEALRAGRHRIEHVEVLDKALIAGLVEYGLTASVQPAFDAYWGGTEAMYAARLGAERAVDTNPFASLAGVGVPLALGSDSPVTTIDPWGAVAAAAGHHNPAQRLSVRAAFAAHTRGGHRAARHDDAGRLVPGAPATLALWDCPAGLSGGLPVLAEGAAAPRCRRTVVAGDTIFEHD